MNKKKIRKKITKNHKKLFKTIIKILNIVVIIASICDHTVNIILITIEKMVQ